MGRIGHRQRPLVCLRVHAADRCQCDVRPIVDNMSPSLRLHHRHARQHPNRNEADPTRVIRCAVIENESDGDSRQKRMLQRLRQAEVSAMSNYASCDRDPTPARVDVRHTAHDFDFGFGFDFVSSKQMVNESDYAIDEARSDSHLWRRTSLAVLSYHPPP